MNKNLFFNLLFLAVFAFNYISFYLKKLFKSVLYYMPIYPGRVKTIEYSDGEKIIKINNAIGFFGSSFHAKLVTNQVCTANLLFGGNIDESVKFWKYHNPGMTYIIISYNYTVPDRDGGFNDYDIIKINFETKKVYNFKEVLSEKDILFGQMYG